MFLLLCIIRSKLKMLNDDDFTISATIFDGTKER